MKEVVTIFGEAEKGSFGTFIAIDSVPSLASYLGNPTPFGTGIHLAVQTLMSGKTILFYRVSEEGMNKEEYNRGLKLLKESPSLPLTALALPGVGDSEIHHLAQSVCKERRAIFIISEADLYDLLTDVP